MISPKATLRKLRGVLQKFCIADPFSTKNQQMDFKPKKLYSPGFNLLFNIVAIPSNAFFILIDEFVHACGILCWVLLFNSLPLSGMSLVLIHPALNLRTHQFTVNCAITLHTSYTKHILA